MSQHQVQVFATTIQKTNELLQDIEEHFGWDDRHLAYLALRCVLHALRDRLLPEQAVALGAQLPMLVRGFFYEGWKLTKVPVKMDQGEFIGKVEQCFFNEPVTESTTEVIQGVMIVLAQHIDPVEILKLQKVLPEDIIQLIGVDD